MAFVMPAAGGSASVRRPAFVSPSALGVSVAVTGSHGASVTTVVDLSASSSACQTTASQRTCNAPVTAPLDTDTFNVTLYDAAPVNGAIPSSAHVLGVGATTQTISFTFTGSVSIALGGQIASIGLGSTFVSAPSNGSVQSIGIVVAPADFGDNAISGSFVNPVTATLTETGGTNHMSLVLNGTPATGPVQLTSSTDVLSVRYDGLGATAYGASIALSASGAPTQTIAISPMYVTTNSALLANGTLSLNGTGTTVSVQVLETNAPSTVTYNVTAGSGCTNVATVSTTTGTGPSASFTATGGRTASASGCTITVADSLATSMSFAVVNSPLVGTLPLPGESAQEYSLAPAASPGPYAVTGGSDGRIWISDVNNGGLIAMTTAGAVTTYSSGGTIIGTGGLVTGADGNLYAADGNHVTIDQFTTSGTNSSQTTVSDQPIAITLGSDGNVWFTESTPGIGSGIIGSLTPSLSLNEYTISAVPSPAPDGIAPGPPSSGSMWFCLNSPSGGAVDAIAMSSGSISQIAALPTTCGQVAMQSDGGALWVASATANEVFRVPTTSPYTAVTVPLTAAPVAFAAGADNAMYITEAGATSYIARIANAAAAPYTPSEFPAPHGTVTGIALGSDGRMWFAENGSGFMGALTP